MEDDIKFRVCEGRSILLPNRSQRGPGAVILRGELPDPLIEEHIKAGFLEVWQETPVFRPEKTPYVGKWDKNPKVLKELSLEQLNIMILEIDPTISPFETKPEAIAQLSADFKK